MCDRPLPQQQLCADLSALIWALPDAAVAPWLRGFWATMAREWTTGIDVLRMEKFLLLVRRVLGASLVWMQAREQKQKKTGARGTKRGAGEEKKEEARVRWDADRAERVLGLLADWPFRPDEESRREEDEDGLMPKMVPVGLKLHALDIWVDEAEKAGLLEEDEDGAGKDDEGTVPGGEVMRRINDLVVKLHSDTLSVAVRKRSKESLADDRLPWNEAQEDETDGEEEEDVWRGLGD